MRHDRSPVGFFADRRRLRNRPTRGAFISRSGASDYGGHRQPFLAVDAIDPADSGRLSLAAHYCVEPPIAALPPLVGHPLVFLLLYSSKGGFGECGNAASCPGNWRLWAEIADPAIQKLTLLMSDKRSSAEHGCRQVPGRCHGLLSCLKTVSGNQLSRIPFLVPA